MLTISNNPTRKGLSVFRPNVIYSTASGVELTMDMLIPQRADTDPSRNPVIVFIQGSAWHFLYDLRNSSISSFFCRWIHSCYCTTPQY